VVGGVVVVAGFTVKDTLKLREVRPVPETVTVAV
jgi:hypothetical protein